MALPLLVAIFDQFASFRVTLPQQVVNYYFLLMLNRHTITVLLQFLVVFADFIKFEHLLFLVIIPNRAAVFCEPLHNLLEGALGVEVIHRDLVEVIVFVASV